MKKKLVLGVVLAAILTTGTAFASPVHPSDSLGIGVLWGGSVDNGFHPGGVALSLKMPSVPIFWGINARFSNNWTSIGVQGDVYLLGSYFVSDILGWFLGVGLYGNFGFNSDHSAIGFGARLPVGLTFQPFHLLEVFFNLAPHVGAWVHSYHGFEMPVGGFFGAEIGVRLWF